MNFLQTNLILLLNPWKCKIDFWQNSYELNNWNFLVGLGLVGIAEFNMFWNMSINLKQRNCSGIWKTILFFQITFDGFPKCLHQQRLGIKAHDFLLHWSRPAVYRRSFNTWQLVLFSHAWEKYSTRLGSSVSNLINIFIFCHFFFIWWGQNRILKVQNIWGSEIYLGWKKY